MNRIAELRKKAGLSQNGLGEVLGVSQQTISKYEKADINVPADILSKMAKLFNVPIEYILWNNIEEKKNESDIRNEIMKLYRSLDQYNKETWIILGKRLLGAQIQNYRELLNEKDMVLCQDLVQVKMRFSSS